MTPATTSVRSGGRPRQDDADQRIMQAALREYAEHGRAGFSLNGVARRAGVGKSSLYLRWPDKDALLADSVDTLTRDIEHVDTGSLRGDLAALALNVTRTWLDPAGWVTMRIAVDAVGDPGPPAAYHETTRDLHTIAAGSIVARAVARGEVDESTPVGLLVQALYGTLLMQVLTRSAADGPPDETELEERTSAVVDFVLSAIRDHLT
ncbi:MAG: transcriptional regulator, TetR family [Marmoricola sp.]|nr:transcriptional regulator, TetR family [Marmoricola sp.]